MGRLLFKPGAVVVADQMTVKGIAKSRDRAVAGDLNDALVEAGIAREGFQQTSGGSVRVLSLIHI